MGELRQKIQIQTTANVSDGMGGIVEGSVTTLRTTRAKVERDLRTVQGVKGLEYGTLVENEACVFTFRYREDTEFTNTAKIVMNGKTYTVHAVIQVDERRKWVKVLGYIQK